MSGERTWKKRASAQVCIFVLYSTHAYVTHFYTVHFCKSICGSFGPAACLWNYLSTHHGFLPHFSILHSVVEHLITQHAFVAHLSTVHCMLMWLHLSTVDDQRPYFWTHPRYVMAPKRESKRQWFMSNYI